MSFDQQRSDSVCAAIWLIGFGVLFATSYWWPGIMFLVGVTSIVQGLVKGRGWYSFQAGLWSIGIGVWALFHFHIAVLFILLGVSMLLGAFFRPPILTSKAPVDHSLE